MLSIANSIFPIKSVGQSVGRVLILQGLQACYQCMKHKISEWLYLIEIWRKHRMVESWWVKNWHKDKQGRQGRVYASIYKPTETGESGEITETREPSKTCKYGKLVYLVKLVILKVDLLKQLQWMNSMNLQGLSIVVIVMVPLWLMISVVDHNICCDTVYITNIHVPLSILIKLFYCVRYFWLSSSKHDSIVHILCTNLR